MRPSLARFLIAFVLLACDNTDVTGPQTPTVIVDALPTSVVVGDESSITVSVFLPDGSPAPGASVEMESTLGTLETTQLVLDVAGQASTVFEAGSEPGIATVSAAVTVNGEEAQGAIEIEIEPLSVTQVGADEIDYPALAGLPA